MPLPHIPFAASVCNLHIRRHIRTQIHAYVVEQIFTYTQTYVPWNMHVTCLVVQNMTVLSKKISTCIAGHTHIHIIHTYTHTHSYVCVFIYIYMCVCVYIYIYIHIYAYIHTWVLVLTLAPPTRRGLTSLKTWRKMSHSHHAISRVDLPI
jgi:hypothetical protein